MASDYGIIAEFYDRLNSDVDYSGLAAFYDREFRADGKKPEIVLDLACGTGRLTRCLAQLRYDMIGVDGSIEMLQRARETLEGTENVLLLCQQMDELDLFGTIDAAVCCLDGLNSLLTDGEFETVLKKVSLFLMPGGLFIFDLNSRYKFEQIFADNVYLYDYDEICCVWQNRFDKKSEICDFELTYFIKEGQLYSRADELLRERLYDDGAVTAALHHAGFEFLRRYSDPYGGAVSEKSERIYYVVRKKEN